MLQKLSKLFLTSIISLSFLFGVDDPQDSTVVVSPKKAALWSIIPGGGQFYNRQYLKAGAVVIAEAFYIWKFNENRINYRYYNDALPFSKSRYLDKRNKYAWWIGFVWAYGMLDAVVEAHLKPFNDIMNEDIETGQIKEEKEDIDEE